MPVVCPNCLATFPQRINFCGLCGSEIRQVEETIQTCPDPLVGLIVSDRYRIVSLLGRGGIGAVYKAEHTAIGKPVALKILHGNLTHRKEILQRFRREAEAASRLTHIHTVQVFDYGHWRGLAYLVMEYLRGTDLASLIRRDGPIGWQRASGILIQMCDSLAEAHQAGIVHRDVKPENVLIVPRPAHPDFVKVLDFGLAKIRDDRQSLETTGDGSLLGTPFYMAPEQIRGEAVDGRTDVYAMGGVLYRCLTGLPPFEAPTPFAVLTRVLSDPVVPPSARVPGLAIPPEVDAFVLRAMAKSPADRFPSAEAMRTALASFVAPHAPSTAEVVVVPTPPAVPTPGESAARLPASAAVPPSGPVPSGPVPSGPVPSAPVPPVPPMPGTGASSPSLSAVSSVSLSPAEADLSRDEFERYLRRFRIKRSLGWTFALLVLVAGAASPFVVPRLLRPPGGPVTIEEEPNDRLSLANRIAVGAAVKGRIGRRISPTEGDLDHYRVEVRPLRQWSLRVDVTAIPGMDLRLDVYGPAGGEPMATVDQGGPGAAESVPGLLVDGLVYFVRVSEHVAEDGVPSERLSDSYDLLVTVRPASEAEAEPNDDPATAVALESGSAIEGWIETATDRDIYCVTAPTGPVTVQLQPPAGLDPAIEIGTALIDAGDAGVPEAANVTPSEPCLVVRLSPDAGEAGAASVGPYEAYRIEVR